MEETEESLKLLRKETKKLISSNLVYCKYMKSLADKLKSNPKKFWSFHSIKSKSETARSCHILWSGQVCQESNWESTPVQWILQHCLHENSTWSHGVPLWCNTAWSVTAIKFLQCRNQVKDILTKLDSTKSTGVDGISASILRECAGELSFPGIPQHYFSIYLSKLGKYWYHGRELMSLLFSNQTLKKKLRTIALFHY